MQLNLVFGVRSGCYINVYHLWCYVSPNVVLSWLTQPKHFNWILIMHVVKSVILVIKCMRIASSFKDIYVRYKKETCIWKNLVETCKLFELYFSPVLWKCFQTSLHQNLFCSWHLWGLPGKSALYGSTVWLRSLSLTFLPMSVCFHRTARWHGGCLLF